jgi:hypothetical protein
VVHISRYSVSPEEVEEKGGQLPILPTAFSEDFTVIRTLLPGELDVIIGTGEELLRPFPVGYGDEDPDLSQAVDRDRIDLSCGFVAEPGQDAIACEPACNDVGLRHA